MGDPVRQNGCPCAAWVTRAALGGAPDRQLLANASMSALSLSLCVSVMPWGAPA